MQDVIFQHGEMIGFTFNVTRKQAQISSANGWCRGGDLGPDLGTLLVAEA